MLGRQDALIVVIQSLFGTLAFGIFILLGLRHVPAGDASVIFGSFPVVTGLLSLTLFRERPRPRFLIALALATAGTILVIWGDAAAPRSAQTENRAIGYVFLAAAVLSEALFLTLNRTLSQQLPPTLLAATLTVIGLAPAGGAAALEALLGQSWMPPPTAILAMTYYAMVPMTLGLLLWFAGSERTTAGQAALATAVMPLSGLALSTWLLGEPVTVWQAGGCLAIVGALVVDLGRLGE